MIWTSNAGVAIYDYFDRRLLASPPVPVRTVFWKLFHVVQQHDARRGCQR